MAMASIGLDKTRCPSGQTLLPVTNHFAYLSLHIFIQPRIQHAHCWHFASYSYCPFIHDTWKQSWYCKQQTQGVTDYSATSCHINSLFKLHTLTSFYCKVHPHTMQPASQQPTPPHTHNTVYACREQHQLSNVLQQATITIMHTHTYTYKGPSTSEVGHLIKTLFCTSQVQVH